MNKQEIDAYFKIVGAQLPYEVTIALTGAVAGSLMGRIRPSRDIDFAVLTPDKNPTAQEWSQIEGAIKKASERTGIPAQYAHDIDHWSMISFLDYADHQKLYKVLGKAKVCFLSPEYWSIGKMGRFLDLDVQDIITVLKKEKTDPDKLAVIWGKALKASIPSTASSEFKKRVDYFFRTHGEQIWGKKFKVSSMVNRFHECAGIKIVKAP